MIRLYSDDYVTGYAKPSQITDFQIVQTGNKYYINGYDKTHTIIYSLSPKYDSFTKCREFLDVVKADFFRSDL